MKNWKILLLSVIACPGMLFAQQLEVISSSGDFFTNSSKSIAFTIGECVTEAYSSTNKILTQGFHQPYLMNETSIPADVTQTEIEINAYPNPAVSYVILNVKNPAGLSFVLYNIDGKMLQQQKIESIKTFIALDSPVSGNYIIKVMNNHHEIKSFVIIKN